jgi:hypothetical protein
MESHLVLAALDDRALLSVLTALRVPVDLLRDELEESVSVGWQPGMAEHVDAGVASLHMHHRNAEHVIGRAQVLAALPRVHDIDALDLFTAALFDPASGPSTALQRLLPGGREASLAGIVESTQRYRSVAFPTSRSVELSSPLRLGWEDRIALSRCLTTHLRGGELWTYRPVAPDELELYVESSVDPSHVLGWLHEVGLIPR